MNDFIFVKSGLLYHDDRLNSVTGSTIRMNLDVQRLAPIAARAQRTRDEMKADAHDRVGKSMDLAARLRKQGYTAKSLEALEALWQIAHDFDIRTTELYRFGWLDFVPPPCTKYVSKVLTMRMRQLEAAARQNKAQPVRASGFAPAQQVVAYAC